MNGYNLSRQWFDFAFENPNLVSGNHAGVYLWAVELNNRLGWVKKFGLPSEVAMQAVGIKSYKTYSGIFEDLVNWGFFEVHQRSKNQYTANVIALVKFTEASTEAPPKALTNAISKQGEKQFDGTVGIIKPKTIKPKTNKPQTDVDADRVGKEKAIVVDPVKEEKKGTPPPKVAPKGSPSVHEQIRQKIETLNDGYYWQGKDGKALSSLITKIKFKWKSKHGSDPSEQQIVESFQWMIDNLPDWYRNKWDTCTIESKFESIIKQINEDRKNGKPANHVNDTKPNETGISPRLQRTWELIAEHYQGNPA